MAERSRRVENQVHKLGTRVLSVIGRQTWMDRPSYRFENILSFVFNALGGARDRVTNALNGVWLGHPIHPALASVSSGALATTVALDAISVLPGRPEQEQRDVSQFAGHALGIGILGSVAAAVTGVTDWQHTHEADRRIGVVHGVMNTIAIALFAASWWDRRRGRHLRGLVGSTLGYGLTVGSGYLGGHLAFGSGVGIDQSGPRLIKQEWTPVLPVASLPEQKPHRVEVDGVGLVLCRARNEVSAVGEFCPHLGAPMSDGWVERGRIVCPWHGSRFDVETGDVLRGPSAAKLPCYQTQLVNGVVEVRAGSHNGNKAMRRNDSVGAVKGVAL